MSESAVAESRARHGVNQLQEAPPTPPWRRFLAQFQELVIGIPMVDVSPLYTCGYFEQTLDEWVAQGEFPVAWDPGFR